MNIPFQAIDWNLIPEIRQSGLTGESASRTLLFPGLRIRLVSYTPGYLADHWCQKGHIVHCLEGAFTSEMQHGEIYDFTKGKSYVVSDELSSHRSSTIDGAVLLIIDGDFLLPD